MIKLRYKLILACIFLITTAFPAFAQDINLSWDASPTPDIAGYKVYYKQGSTSLPFDGVGALEGPSPVDIGNNLTATLTGLLDNSIYYFAVTTYDASGNESIFSNIVSNAWMPELLTPAHQAVNEPIPATFQWTTEATGTFNYTLYYGTDADLVASAGSVFTSNGNSFIPEGLYIPLLVAALMLFIRQLPSKRKKVLAGGLLAISFALTACSGGGGGSSDSSSTSATNQEAVATTVYSIPKGTSDYHQAYDLEPGTTYYWKVIGVDPSDPSQRYSSMVASFVTESF